MLSLGYRLISPSVYVYTYVYYHTVSLLSCLKLLMLLRYLGGRIMVAFGFTMMCQRFFYECHLCPAGVLNG